MASGETEDHRRLKRLALAWAQAQGFALAAPEVRVPRSGYRADVAAYAPGPGGDGVAAGRTAVFECKQARADLLKDAHAEEATRARLAELRERRRGLEAMLQTHRPDLRRGGGLWPEFDAWDFSGLEHATYRAVLEEIDTLERRVRGGTKFSKLFRYRSADFLYLVVEENIFAEAEVPAGWGLLVRRGAEEALTLARPPGELGAAAEQRLRMLEAIARAGTREVNRAAGIVPVWLRPPGEEEGEENRESGKSGKRETA